MTLPVLDVAEGVGNTRRAVPGAAFDLEGPLRRGGPGDER